MRFMKHVVLCLALTVLFSCSGNRQIGPSCLSETEIPLQGVTWKLVSFESGYGAITPLPEVDVFVITFNPDSLFDGRTHVNSFSGTYASDSTLKILEIQKMKSTLAEGGQNEARFYSALRQAVRYRAVSDGRVKRLTLFYGADNEALNFVGL